MKHLNFFLFIFVMIFMALISVQAAPIENIAVIKRDFVPLHSASKIDNNHLIKRIDQEDLKESSFDKRNGRARVDGGSKGGETGSTASDPPEIGCGTECKRNKLQQINNNDLIKRRNEQENMKQTSFDKRIVQARDENSGSNGGNNSGSSSDPPGGSCGQRCKRNEKEQKKRRNMSNV